MTLIIKDKSADAAARKLAKLEGKTLTEVVRDALEEKLAARFQEPPPAGDLMTWLQDLNKRHPNQAPVPDKNFYDWLSGEED